MDYENRSNFDKAIEEIKKFKKQDSVILSWSYGDDGTGVVILGRNDPTSMDNRIEIVDAWSDEDGLNRIKSLNIYI